MDANRARNAAIEALDQWYAGDESPASLVAALETVLYQISQPSAKHRGPVADFASRFGPVLAGTRLSYRFSAI
jgi:hypothetical protein